MLQNPEMKNKTKNQSIKVPLFSVSGRTGHSLYAERLHTELVRRRKQRTATSWPLTLPLPCSRKAFQVETRRDLVGLGVPIKSGEENTLYRGANDGEQQPIQHGEGCSGHD